MSLQGDLVMVVDAGAARSDLSCWQDEAEALGAVLFQSDKLPQTLAAQRIIWHGPQAVERMPVMCCTTFIAVCHQHGASLKGIDERLIAGKKAFFRGELCADLDLIDEDWIRLEQRDPDARWRPVVTGPVATPSRAPADLRGRILGADPGNCPDIATLEQCFTATARLNLLLDAEQLGTGPFPAHWRFARTGGIDPARLLSAVDFVLHFPNKRKEIDTEVELLHSVRSGALVLTDPARADLFGGGVVGCTPSDINQLISLYMEHPDKYQKKSLEAQKNLSRWQAAAARADWDRRWEILR